jgi:hypothetical protein
MYQPGTRPSPKALVGAFVLVFVALILAVIAAGVQIYRIHLKKDHPKFTLSEISVSPGRPAKAGIHFEIYPEEEIFPKNAFPDLETLLPEKQPKVAILIDDLGYDKVLADKFLNLGACLAFSILPHSPFQNEIAEAARERGYDILLHLPMEPLEFPKVDPGPHALLMSMSTGEFIQSLTGNLNAIPQIKGVNNHMGSRLTADLNRMILLFRELKKRDLFFVDSLTTKKSKGRDAGQITSARYCTRDVFLDHIPTHDFIRRQIELLIGKATHHGAAIGIAHPHDVTFHVLQESIYYIREKTKLVPISTIMDEAPKCLQRIE